MSSPSSQISDVLDVELSDIQGLIKPEMTPIEELPLLLELARNRCQEPMEVDPPLQFQFHYDKGTSTQDFYPRKCCCGVVFEPMPRKTFQEKAVNTSDRIDGAVQTDPEDGGDDEVVFIATSRKRIHNFLVAYYGKFCIKSFLLKSLYEFAGSTLTLCCN